MSDQYLCGPDMMLELWDWSSETPSPLSRAEGTQVLQAKPCHIALLGFQALPGTGFRHLLGISLSTWWHSFCPKPTFPPALLSFLPSWDFYGYILHCCSWAWELLNDCALFCGSAQAQIHIMDWCRTTLVRGINHGSLCFVRASEEAKCST